MCSRKHIKNTDVFENLFKACVARYIHQLMATGQGDDQQWAVMLLRDAMLTYKTLSDITFQLTTGASLEKGHGQTVTLDAQMVKYVSETLLTSGNERGIRT